MNELVFGDQYVRGELEQGLRLMNLIDHEEGRRAGELVRLNTGGAWTMLGWPINEGDTLT